MPRGFRQSRTGKTARALLLAAAAVALLRPASVQAQSIGLRGSITDPALPQQPFADPLAGAAASASAVTDPLSTAATVPYQPVSPGAVPDGDNAGGSTLDVPDTADVEVSPTPARPKRQGGTGRSGDGDAADAAAPAKPKTAAIAEDETAQGPANPRAMTLDADEKQPLDPRAERTGAIEAGNRKPDDDPFAPVGIKAGSFTLRPSIEQGVTATSNADSSFGGRPATLSETTLRLDGISDWATNSAKISGYGTFRRTISGYDVKDARGRVDGELNLDLDHDWRAIAKLGYEAAPEGADSPVVIQGTVSQPLRQTIDGSLGVTKDVGKMRLGLTGEVSRDIYGDADLSSGGVLSQKARNSTLYTATLRAGYEISPALTPFVELEGGRRVFDQRIDDSGYERSSNRVGARAGLALDLGEKLNGEIAAGWLRESFDDDRLAALASPTVKADFKWSPERGTIIGLRGDTTLEDTTTPGESGSVLYSGQLTAERRIRADLTAKAALGLGWRDYLGSDGHDLIYNAEAGLTWWMNRYAGLTGRVRHESVKSNLPYRDSTTNSVYLGLTLQR
ncbi:outer membrane beta-barrel protein [Mesorhizobium sp. SP-1A]|uniref:outer membrane beta-barrel protein n=1 Tax=Mesorhizobium sp. SP-1A TaxID=3077840 RepID=UPI0028F703E4|nr:outer membrane beta-barrel protein [Mesorhizobium sp. SP-1A]